MTPRYVTAPDHVEAVDLGPAMVLVNYRTGAVKTLLGPAALWWAELSTTGDLRATSGLDRTSSKALLDQLRSAGLLVLVQRPGPWQAPRTGMPWVPSWGTHELAAGREKPVRVPIGATMLAAPALLVVITVLSLGRASRRMARLVRLLDWATGLSRLPADAEQTRRLVHAVRRVGLLAPGRVACLEESAAVTLALAMRGRRATWCHGVAADPIRLHAWVEVEYGRPIAEPPSTARYTPLRTIPRRDNGGEK